ncbi:MAG: LysR family transcriptional regulator [Verrucomicrobiales bacterium]|nr:LysR family transcriptional regulator [Verrucomicrobiales bacterium]
MDTRLLRVFQSVARHGGLTGAARELHLTTSALSHRLKALETELGCRLFERSGRRMLLNQAGEQLLAGIERPLESLAAAAAGLKTLGQWGQGRLRLGMRTPLCDRLMSGILVELRREFARLHLTVECGELPDLSAKVRDRELDLAVGVAWDSEPGVEFRPLFEDELFWAMSPEHPWADGRSLSKVDLRREPMIGCRKGSPSARFVDRYLAGLGVEPTVVMEVECLRTVKDLVLRNQGVAVLSPWKIEEELGRGRLVVRPIGPRGLRRPWVIAHIPGRRFTLAEERFCSLLGREFARLPRDRTGLPKPAGDGEP